MALVKCPTVNIDCSSAEYKNRMSPNKIADLFKQTGPKLCKLVLKNAEDCIFPVESVDAYLREHPENVINVTHLALCFDPRNSVQLLEMVANRFPKIERLSINYSDDHPIEHTLTQFVRMANLIETMLPCGFKELYYFLRARPFAPFTKVIFLYSGHSDGSDTFEHFEATVPVLFPNLIELHIACPSKAFTDQVEAKVRSLFPKMQVCDAVDCEDLYVQ